MRMEGVTPDPARQSDLADELLKGWQQVTPGVEGGHA